MVVTQGGERGFNGGSIILSSVGYRRHEVCGFSQWSEWGQCSVSCGGGKQACVRHPVDLSRIQALSLFCNGSLTEIKDCNQYPCPGNA